MQGVEGLSMCGVMSGRTDLTEKLKYYNLATITSRVDVSGTDAKNEKCGGTARNLKITQPQKNIKGLHEIFSFWSHIKAHEKCYILISILFMVHQLCPNEPAAFCAL
jgi:hypothetical protein